MPKPPYDGPMDRKIGTVPDIVTDGPPSDASSLIIDIVPLGTVGRDTAAIAIAKSFVDSVVAGANATDAALAAGVTLEVVARDTHVRKYIREAKRKYAATAAEIKDVVVLNWLAFAMDDPDPKIRLVALRELSLMPEVGLKNSKPGVVGQRQFSDDTGSVLDAVDDEYTEVG